LRRDGAVPCARGESFLAEVGEIVGRGCDVKGDSESLHRCSCMLGLDWLGARSRRLGTIGCAMCRVQDAWQGCEIGTGLASVGRVNRNRILHNIPIAHRTSPCLGRTTDSVYCNTLLQGTNRDWCRGCDVAILLDFSSTLSRTKPCRSELYRRFFTIDIPCIELKQFISLSFYSAALGHRVTLISLTRSEWIRTDSWSLSRLHRSLGSRFPSALFSRTFSIDRTRVQSLCIR
jgi:hypothetical protein